MTPELITFERQIASYPLRFWPERRALVEDMRFPPMRTVFRQESQRFERPPTQDEFEVACIIAWPGPFPCYLETAIRARLARAYASLVREQHFGLALTEACSELGLRVRESEDLDLRYGIDYVVCNGVASAGIAVRQGTERSREYAARKSWRQQGCVLTAELTRFNRYEVGDFWLYKPGWVKQFIQRQVIPSLNLASKGGNESWHRETTSTR